MKVKITIVLLFLLTVPYQTIFSMCHNKYNLSAVPNFLDLAKINNNNSQYIMRHLNEETLPLRPNSASQLIRSLKLYIQLPWSRKQWSILTWINLKLRLVQFNNSTIINIAVIITQLKIEEERIMITHLSYVSIRKQTDVQGETHVS